MGLGWASEDRGPPTLCRMTDTAALDRGIARGIAVFRWLALGWAWVGLAFEWDEIERPAAAVAGLLVATLVSAVATVLVAAKDGRLFGTAFLWTELAVGVSLLVLDGWVYGAAREQSLPWAWPAAGIVALAVARGTRAGLVGAGGCAAASFVGESILRDNVEWSVSAASKSALYVLAAVGAGAVSARLREAEREISTARAREDMARTLHDGVLQTLAVIQRRSEDDELRALARDQERDLRGFLFGQARPAAGVAAALRRAGDDVARRHGISPQLVLAEDLPALHPTVTNALAGAVGEALTNAAKHSGAARVVLFAEPAELDGEVFCSVRDDGAGFRVEDVIAGEGLARSIRARIEEIGGRVEVDSRPGRGTEVRMWVS
jgi:signal transduction histidine kinase